MVSDGLQLWLQKTLSSNDFQCSIISGDASFRSYYRIAHGSQSFVAMDAGKDKDSLPAFVNIAKTLTEYDLLAPQIYEQDLEKGFLLLSDFGDTLYLNQLDANSVDVLYQRAMTSLVRMQAISDVNHYALPEYNRELYLREMNLFREWYLEKHLKLQLTTNEHQLLDHIYEYLIAEALAQPQVFVHRDYHSRNLMVVEPNQVAILDFQDAVLGPVTYDLLSLLKDCYISWPKAEVSRWVRAFLTSLNSSRATAITEFEQFYSWFNLIGLQRHLKCVGIFARLNHRDQKAKFLADIPRVLNYTCDVVKHYPELKEFQIFLTKRNIIS